MLLDALGFTSTEMAVTGEARIQPRAESTLPDVPLVGWVPHVIARSKLGKGVHRPALGIGATLLALLALLVASALRGVGSEEGAVDDLRTRAQELVSALEEVDRTALGGLLTPDTGVAEATTALVHLHSAGRNLFESAGAIGEGSRDRERRNGAASLAAEALDLERTLGDAWTYQLAVMPLRTPPELDPAMDPVQAAAALTGWEADLLAARDGLAVPSPFSEHRESYDELLESFERWRTDYLDALSSGDRTRAAAAIDDLEATIADLDIALQAARQQLTSETRRQIDRMREAALNLAQ